MGEGGVVDPERARGLSPRLAALRARLTRPPEPSGGPDRAFRCRRKGAPRGGWSPKSNALSIYEAQLTLQLAEVAR